MMSSPARSARRARWRRLAPLVLLLVTWLLAGPPARGQGPGQGQNQGTLFDPALGDLRRASVAWDRRGGPEREVVDVVCLVPDAATFLEAIAAWDQKTYFPILIDDVEYTFKFLRAFRPSRIVRYPSKAAPLSGPALWDRAVQAVGQAWTAGAAAPAVAGGATSPPPSGDLAPKDLGPTPPGVVLSAPDSPMLAGAVALAAGRFQPLLRWQTPSHFADVPSNDEARAMAREIAAVVGGAFPKYDQLGDDCDFVTLAGDYPYRYVADASHNAFDDLILRSEGSHRRWAYAGRLLGGPVESVYRAMCALFLPPATALMFNSYETGKPPWSDYAMTVGTNQLNRVVPTSHVVGERASLVGWHQTFDPWNRYGLVILNTHGGPTAFHLPGGLIGQTADIPVTTPAALVVTHSFSAAAPDDPQTLAGRWLANGAYIYFGSVNEPFLQAFRTPTMITSALAENLPLSAAVRKTAAEPFGQPWRLMYLGDPLWRVRPLQPPTPRRPNTEQTANWPGYGAYHHPGDDAPDATRLTWALKMAIHGLQAGGRPGAAVDVAPTLLGVARGTLDAPLRTLHDALLIDTLEHANRSAELMDRLTRIPPAERSEAVRRHLETCQAAALQRAAVGRDVRQALALWSDVVRAQGSTGFVEVFSTRVAAQADNPAKQTLWRDRLRVAAQANVEPANAGVIQAELKQVNDKLGPGRGR